MKCGLKFVLNLYGNLTDTWMHNMEGPAEFKRLNSCVCMSNYFEMGAWPLQLLYSVCVELTEMRSSLVLTRTLLRFQDTVGSGWPRGGTHSNTAGSPAATTTSLGACRKSSLRTEKKTQRNLISFRSPACLIYLTQRLNIRTTDPWAASTDSWPLSSKETLICFGHDLDLFSWLKHLLG